MILHSTWKKVILFSLIDFSSQCSALYCVFNGWRADEPRSTLPKVEKAAFTVVHSKIHNLVYIGAAYWCRLFICTLKCWIYCYITLYTLQNSSGQLLFLWIPLLCLLLRLLSSVAASCSLTPPPPAAVIGSGTWTYFPQLVPLLPHPCYSFRRNAIMLQYLLSRLD